jgi:hypothetical protein
LSYVATEDEKAQALREATEQYQIIYVDDPRVEPRSKKTWIEHRAVGYLGEIVLSNRLHWTRHYVEKLNQVDIERSDHTKVEVKTRRKFYPNHSKDMMAIAIIKKCDDAVLLHNFKNEKCSECFEQVGIFRSRNYLERHGWKIWVSRKIWNEYTQHSG